ncbi:MAG TPA: YbhN family protein [Trueperaceae bacterium]|jgi:uncharacterized protein (TIRG00374 family)
MKRGAWLALLFGAGGLVVTMWLLGENLASLGRVPAWAFVVGAVLLVVNYLAAGARLQLLTRLGGQPLPLGACLRAYAVGLLSAAITPGSAGQAPAVALALVRDGLTGVAAWSVNVYVWVLDLAFLAYSVPLSVLLIGRSAVALSRVELVAFAVVVAALAAFLMWVLTFRLRWVTRLGRALFGLRWLGRWRGSAAQFFDRVESASGAIMHGTLAQRAVLHALTAVVYLSTLATFWVMLTALSPGAPFLTTLAVAQLPTVLATFMPTPGGAGLLEIFTASLFLAGPGGGPGGTNDRSPGGTVAAAILGWRLLTFYSRFVLGPIAGATFARPPVEPTREAEAGS